MAITTTPTGAQFVTKFVADRDGEDGAGETLFSYLHKDFIFVSGGVTKERVLKRKANGRTKWVTHFTPVIAVLQVAYGDTYGTNLLASPVTLGAELTRGEALDAVAWCAADRLSAVVNNAHAEALAALV